jgi:hypothetical protein
MLRKYKRKIFLDTFFVLISIVLAIYLEKAGLINEFILAFGDFRILAILIGGIFFTSIFTTASAIVLLAEMSLMSPLALVVILGGIGSVMGDYVIFRFVKDRVVEDFKHLLSYQKRKRLRQVFRRKLFRYFVPFIGGLIIASPLPDELGVSVLSLSKLEEKYFFAISFFCNSAGILAIALIARGIFG